MNTTKIARYAGLTAIFLLPFVPLIVSDSLFFPFITGKNFAFRILAEVAFLSWLILAVRDRSYRPSFSWISWGVLALTGVALLAAAFGVNPEKAIWSNFERMEGWITVFHLALYFFAASAIMRAEREWAKLFHVFLGVGLFASLFGLLQVSGELVINQGGLRVDATTGNAIYFAGFLLWNLFTAGYLAFGNAAKRNVYAAWSGILGFGLFAAYYLWLLSDKAFSSGTAGNALLAVSVLAVAGFSVFVSRRAHDERPAIALSWYAVLSALFTVMIFFTATRGTILGLVGGVLLLGLVFLCFGKGHKGLRIAGASIVGAAVLAVGGFFLVRDSAFVRESPILGRIASISANSSDAQARFMIWGIALEGAKEKPVLGWGQDGFNEVFNKYYDPEMYGRESWFDRAHNVFLDWLVAAGALGLAAYLFLYVAALYVIWKKSRFTFGEKAVATAALAAYAFHNMFVFDNVLSYLSFFTFLSLAHSSAHAAPSPAADKAIEALAPTQDAKDAWPIGIAAAGVVLMFMLNWNAYQGAHGLLSALQYAGSDPERSLSYFEESLARDTVGKQETREQLAQFYFGMKYGGAPADFLGHVNELLSSELKKHVVENDGDARAHVFYALYLRETGDLAGAETQFARAAELSPAKQDILFSLASVKLSLGKTEEAYQLFKKAYDEAPRFADSQKNYAIGAIATGRFAEASAVFASSTDPGINGLGIRYDGTVAETYFAAKKYADAIEIWDKLYSKTADIQFKVNVVIAQVRNGERAKAVATVREMIALKPEFKAQGEGIISDIWAGKQL
jgi:tetratricopeptide (TPR) repeat protein